MAENIIGTARQQVYATHHRDQDYWPQSPVTADQIEIVSDPLPRNRGHFKRGHNPRRHQFTSDECSRGFWAAIDSIITRYPNAIMADGRHIACNFLKSRSPHTYERSKNRSTVPAF